VLNYGRVRSAGSLLESENARKEKAMITTDELLVYADKFGNDKGNSAHVLIHKLATTIRELQALQRATHKDFETISDQLEAAKSLAAEHLNAFQTEYTANMSLSGKLEEAESRLTAEKELASKVILGLQSRLREIETATIERCAKVCDEVGVDWRDAGDMIKFYATNYLVEKLRALAPDRTTA
jgi:outer membrane murein-binding lipoprotein Lpp